jgi:O-acetyl-ADP-ribose deacetylase (regulator of RNase III)
MAIETVRGDIFDSPLQAITDPVNCFGNQGKGLALQFKHHFSNADKDYRDRCKKGQVRPGKPYLYTRSTPWILFFPTKDHWRNPSQLNWIREGLDYISEYYERWGLFSLAIPKLGCGLGGLDWKVVKASIYNQLEDTNMLVWIYE